MSGPAGPAQPAVSPVIAHRGASGTHPENTLASLQQAADLGCRWVEFDCMLTRDGQVVLLHDASLRRTTGDPRDIHDVDLAEAQRLDAGSWLDPAFAGARIPTLAATTDLLKKTGMGALVEVKAGNGDPKAVAEAVTAFLQQQWPASLPPPVLCSFSEQILSACAESAPDLPRGLGIWQAPPDWDTQARRFGCTAIHANHDFLDAETAHSILAAGYTLRAYTVNEPARAAELFDQGVHSVFSDYPDRMPRA